MKELFLLLRRPDGKPARGSAQNGFGLAAAVVTDLVLAEQVRLGYGKDPRVRIDSHRAIGNPILDAAMKRLREKPDRKFSTWSATAGSIRPATSLPR